MPESSMPDSSTPDSSTHFYEPRLGHRLPHDPFNAIVGPRPIGWISSRNAQGGLNLAPYSFFNGFNYVPPIIGFSSITEKDTLRNVRATGEFAWNLATQPLAQAMNASCAMVPPDVNEFELAGLTPVASRVIGGMSDSTRTGAMCKPEGMGRVCHATMLDQPQEPP